VEALLGRRDEALAVLNGAIGDRLLAGESSLAVRMQLFHGTQLWALEDPPLTVPDARPQACLFVHGLMGSERAWRFGVGAGGAGVEDPGARVDYGPAIATERDQTPIYVRYNSGRHISENGRELADKLEQLFAAWPFEQLSIVAHSMGGLVTRSACHYALEAGHQWIERLRRVFLLGVPSRGAPLELLAHVTAFTLDRIWNPWTKLIGKAINLRSAGIKDLRHGFVLDEDWRHYDLDRVGTLGESGSTLAATIGDGLVRSSSAQGASVDPRERELLPPAEVQHFAATSHLALMNDPAVLAQVLEWWRTSAD
jgi:pimeloyl-ACP methyl ester carboxylesterase